MCESRPGGAASTDDTNAESTTDPTLRHLLEARRWEREGLGDLVRTRYRPVLTWALVHQLLTELEEQLRADFATELEQARRDWELEADGAGQRFAHRQHRLIYERLLEMEFQRAPSWAQRAALRMLGGEATA